MQNFETKKSNKLENIRERIVYFFESQEDNRDIFLEKTKLKKGIFDSKDYHRAVGSDKISKILELSLIHI